MHKAKAPTYGAWLATRRDQGHTVRIRAGSEAFDGATYAFYPERSLLEDEFNAIWDAQSAFYPDMLTPERREHLFTVMFHQRPLKKPRIGKCAFNPKEERLSKAHPLFQEFRLYKEINELELVLEDQTHQKLTLDQRNALIKAVRPKQKMTFTSMRKTLKLPSEIVFNKESDNRRDIKGDEVYGALGDKKRFGPQWSSFDQEQQWQIIRRLKDE